METKNKTIEVLQQMKARRGNDTIILFHNGDNFEAYVGDAQIIAAELGLEAFVRNELLTIRFPRDKQEEYSNRLLDKGYAVCISEMRDASGNFITDIAVENE
jgi:DNA mismatch repair protein MutS